METKTTTTEESKEVVIVIAILEIVNCYRKFDTSSLQEDKGKDAEKTAKEGVETAATGAAAVPPADIPKDDVKTAEEAVEVLIFLIRNREISTTLHIYQFQRSTKDVKTAEKLERQATVDQKTAVEKVCDLY